MINHDVNVSLSSYLKSITKWMGTPNLVEINTLNIFLSSKYIELVAILDLTFDLLSYGPQSCNSTYLHIWKYT